MGPLGLPEVIAIFIIALVVFGPKKLPELGKSLGRGLREFNKAKNDLKATWDEQLREAENQIQSAKETVHEPVRETIAAVSSANPVANPDNEVSRENDHESIAPPANTEPNSELPGEPPASSKPKEN